MHRGLEPKRPSHLDRFLLPSLQKPLVQGGEREGQLFAVDSRHDLAQEGVAGSAVADDPLRVELKEPGDGSLRDVCVGFPLTGAVVKLAAANIHGPEFR